MRKRGARVDARQGVLDVFAPGKPWTAPLGGWRQEIEVPVPPVPTEPLGLPAKAISVRQPWAWAIVHAGKDIENRDWSTRFRGPVCIHAAKGMTRAEHAEAAAFMGAFLGPVDDDRLLRWHGLCAAPDRLERGGIVGVAEIVDCVEASGSPWFMGRYGFVLANARPVPFVPAKGALGFFDWEPAAQAA